MTMRLALLLASLLALQSVDEFARADEATRRLPPSAIPALPTQVRLTLERKGCTVPQVSGRNVPHNAVRGAFRASNTMEWAVLCSKARTSSILVVTERSGAVVAELATRADANFLQRAGPYGIIFSRNILLAPPDSVSRLRSRETGRATTVDHDGIRDEFVDKYASVWYWDGRDWLRIPGSD
jgi:hypothetical protein